MIELLVGVAVLAPWALAMAVLFWMVRAGLRIILGALVLTHPTHSPHAIAERAAAQRRADNIAWAYDRMGR